MGELLEINKKDLDIQLAAGIDIVRIARYIYAGKGEFAGNLILGYVPVLFEMMGQKQQEGRERERDGKINSTLEFGALARSGGIRSPPYVAFDRQLPRLGVGRFQRNQIGRYTPAIHGLGWVGLGWVGLGRACSYVRCMWATAKHVYTIVLRETRRWKRPKLKLVFVCATTHPTTPPEISWVRAPDRVLHCHSQGGERFCCLDITGASGRPATCPGRNGAERSGCRVPQKPSPRPTSASRESRRGDTNKTLSIDLLLLLLAPSSIQSPPPPPWLISVSSRRTGHCYSSSSRPSPSPSLRSTASARLCIWALGHRLSLYLLVPLSFLHTNLAQSANQATISTAQLLQ